MRGTGTVTEGTTATTLYPRPWTSMVHPHVIPHDWGSIQSPGTLFPHSRGGYVGKVVGAGSWGNPPRIPSREEGRVRLRGRGRGSERTRLYQQWVERSV